MKKTLSAIILLIFLMIASVSIFTSCKKNNTQNNNPEENQNTEPTATYTFDEKDKSFVTFGKYPQTKVDVDIAKIKAEGVKNDFTNWYDYDGKTYAIATSAEEFETTDPKFQDGSVIEKGKEYAFLVEPLVWKVIYSPVNEILLFSTKVIESSNFNMVDDKKVDPTYGYYLDTNVYVNSYYHSNLRSSINNFYQIAFDAQEKKDIVVKIQDNINTNSEKNFYAVHQINTEDAVFALSYNDFYQSAYKINISIDEKVYKANRVKTITDYAAARGSFYAGDTRVAPYWLRSSGKTSSSASTVDPVGSVNESSYIDSHLYGVCPALFVKKY